MPSAITFSPPDDDTRPRQPFGAERPSRPSVATLLADAAHYDALGLTAEAVECRAAARMLLREVSVAADAKWRVCFEAMKATPSTAADCDAVREAESRAWAALREAEAALAATFVRRQALVIESTGEVVS